MKPFGDPLDSVLLSLSLGRSIDLFYSILFHFIPFHWMIRKEPWPLDADNAEREDQDRWDD